MTEHWPSIHVYGWDMVIIIGMVLKPISDLYCGIWHDHNDDDGMFEIVLNWSEEVLLVELHSTHGDTASANCQLDLAIYVGRLTMLS